MILCNWLCNAVAKTWSTEICNNLDDNCNWQIDEWLNCGTGNGWWPFYESKIVDQLSKSEEVATKTITITAQVILEKLHWSAKEEPKLYILPESWAK